MNNTIVDEATSVEDKFIEAASRKYGTGGAVEIDEPPRVSMSGDGGGYVQAWVWVSDKEAGIEPHENPEHVDYKREVCP